MKIFKENLNKFIIFLNIGIICFEGIYEEIMA